MSMTLLQSAYKILITRVRFKRRTISVTPFSGNYRNHLSEMATLRKCESSTLLDQ